MNRHIEVFLEQDTENLLTHSCTGIPKQRLTLPEPRFVDRAFMNSDRPNGVLVNLQRLFDAGRLGGTGYLSLFPVDQGVEHSGGASFSRNPDYFDPRKIVTLAIEGGCNGVASTAGVLGQVAREFAHHIPFMLKLNHNELLSQHPAEQVLRQKIRKWGPASLLDASWDLMLSGATSLDEIRPISGQLAGKNPLEVS